MWVGKEYVLKNLSLGLEKQIVGDYESDVQNLVFNKIPGTKITDE